jgi:hypothetical protein
MHRQLHLAALAALFALFALSTTTARAQTAPNPGTRLGAPAEWGSQPPTPPTAPPPAQYPQPYYPYYQPYPPYPPPPAYGYVPPVSRRHREIVGYRQETRNPPSVWGTGLGFLLSGWVLNFAILTPIANAVSIDRPGASEQDAWAWSLLPVAGPLIQLALEAPHPAIPIISGLMQLGGLIAFVAGLSSRETRSVPVYRGDPDDPSMLRVEMDASTVQGGGVVQLTLSHL